MLSEHVSALRTHEFTLPAYIAYAATFFFAITGAIVGIKRNYDIIGVFVMAFITGLGGALVRDGIFIQDGPPALTRDPNYIIIILGGCLVGWLMGKTIERYQKPLAIIDALGMAAYCVVGAQISMKAGLSAPAAVLIGIINSCGAGLLRDIITRDEPLMLKPGQIYVVAAAIGSTLYIWLARHTPLGGLYSGLIAMGSALSLRLLAIYFNWHTKPVSTWRPPFVYLIRPGSGNTPTTATTIVMPPAPTSADGKNTSAKTQQTGTPTVIVVPQETIQNAPTTTPPITIISAPAPQQHSADTPATPPAPMIATPIIIAPPADTPNTPENAPPPQIVIITPAAPTTPTDKDDTPKQPTPEKPTP